MTCSPRIALDGLGLAAGLALPTGVRTGIQTAGGGHRPGPGGLGSGPGTSLAARMSTPGLWERGREPHRGVAGITRGTLRAPIR